MGVFGLQVFDDVVLNVGKVYGDIGFGGECVYYGLDQFRLMCGVDVNVCSSRKCNSGCG